MARSGVIHFIAEDDRHAVLLCQKLLSFLPSNNLEDPPRLEGDTTVEPDPLLETLVPDDGKKGYDVRHVIARVVDAPTSGSAVRLCAQHRHRLCARHRARWASWPTSPWCRPVRWTSTRPTSPRASSASATPSTFRC
jgi:hypothetical protein